MSLEDNLMRLFGSDRIAALMDKMGMEEGEVIQHSMITNSIERAQKKVEENNFGTRKRLLEYDDVMNAQREVVYKRRRNALHGDRLEVDILNLIYDVSEGLVAGHKVTNDFESLALGIVRTFGYDTHLTAGELAALPAPTLTQKLYDEALAYFQSKNEHIAAEVLPLVNNLLANNTPYENIAVPFTDGRKQVQAVANLKKAQATGGHDILRQMEKVVVLSVIDTAWTQHLRQMDDLKQVVQNAVYEQKDPLLVYKFESFELFKRMIGKVNEETANFLFHADMPVQQEAVGTNAEPEYYYEDEEHAPRLTEQHQDNLHSLGAGPEDFGPDYAAPPPPPQANPRAGAENALAQRQSERAVHGRPHHARREVQSRGAGRVEPPGRAGGLGFCGSFWKAPAPFWGGRFGFGGSWGQRRGGATNSPKGFVVPLIAERPQRVVVPRTLREFVAPLRLCPRAIRPAPLTFNLMPMKLLPAPPLHPGRPLRRPRPGPRLANPHRPPPTRWQHRPNQGHGRGQHGRGAGGGHLHGRGHLRGHRADQRGQLRWLCGEVEPGRRRLDLGLRRGRQRLRRADGRGRARQPGVRGRRFWQRHLPFGGRQAAQQRRAPNAHRFHQRLAGGPLHRCRGYCRRGLGAAKQRRLSGNCQCSGRERPQRVRGGHGGGVHLARRAGAGAVQRLPPTTSRWAPLPCPPRPAPKPMASWPSSPTPAPAPPGPGACALGDADSDVLNCLAVNGPNVYVGGGFSLTGAGTPPPASIPYTLAKITDNGATAALGWTQNLGDNVTALAVAGTDLYVAGDFWGTRLFDTVPRD